MWYWVKTHWFIRQAFPSFLWKMPDTERCVYLTFDDGPIPEVTRWVLQQLELFQAKATFFCIGENVEKNRSLFNYIKDQGHAIGNHTYSHLNGWRTDFNTYVNEVARCDNSLQMETTLFRPPYGKISRKQRKHLQKLGKSIVMWDVLSADFDERITPFKCCENVLKNIQNGSIIIFHDSVKAEKNLRYALPKTLEWLRENKFEMRSLPQTCS